MTYSYVHNVLILAHSVAVGSHHNATQYSDFTQMTCAICKTGFITMLPITIIISGRTAHTNFRGLLLSSVLLEIRFCEVFITITITKNSSVLMITN